MTQTNVGVSLIGELHNAMKLINLAGNYAETAENIAKLIAVDSLDEELRMECECFVAAVNDLTSLHSLLEFL